MLSIRRARHDSSQETRTEVSGRRKLRWYQQAAFDRFKDEDSFPCVMEMRLGKSILAIRWVRHRLAALGIRKPRILLVAPRTPLIDWMEELERDEQKFTLIHGGPTKRSNLLNGRDGWFVSTYSSLIFTPEIKDKPWDAVILDESTTIKNVKARVTKCCHRWFRDVRLKCILTGLPNPQSELELWSQMAWVNGGSWMDVNNYYKWRTRVAYLAGFSWEVKRDARPKIKAHLHEDAFVLSRSEAKVGSIKIPVRRSGVLAPKERKIYRTAVTRWEIPGIAKENTEAKHNVVICSWLRRITGGHLPTHAIECWKYEELIRLLGEDLQGQQVVIWFAFNQEIHRCYAILKRAGISATCLYGDVSLYERSRRINKFRSGSRRVILCQVACGKYGLDLAVADTAIYFSNSYSYEARRQSEDRIVSANKTNPLAIIDLITENTVDEDVYEGLQKRQEKASYYINAIRNSRRLG